MSFVEILIADDHEFFRHNLRSLIESQPGLRVCGEAADGIEAIEKAKALRPQIVLMDMSMPRMDGAEATRNLRRQIDAHVIIVSQNDPALMRKIAAETGAHAFVSKSDVVRDLIPAILNLVSADGHGSAADTHKKESVQSDWLQAPGNLASRIWEFDWSKTPLGPLQAWPQSLRTAVNLMLNSQHPIWIGWGPEMTYLYNDAYISVLSLAKHPWALGKPAREVWAEIWDVCGPLADKVFLKGEPSYVDDVRLFMNRGDFLEETYYSFSYSPIYDEAGKVSGLFCPSTEITSKVLNARRLRTLSELSAKSVSESTEAAAAACIRICSQNPDDIPFALLYLIDPEKKIATLQGASQVDEGLPSVSPLTIALDPESPPTLWPISELFNGSGARTVELADGFSIPLGAANQRVAEAIVLPVTSVGMRHPVGIIIAGVNPTRKLDAEYRTFFSLIADQVATAIQNARALQQEKERADALAEIDRTKTTFFSNVSHEFRTPLTLMISPLEEMLSSSSAIAPEQRERIEIAHRNSLRLLKLVNTLLDFSRIEAGRIQASYEPTDLCKLTSDLASVFRSVIEGAGIRFTLDCEFLDEPVYVDSEMWEKIVFNLLSNAFKFTFVGEIAVSLTKVEGGVELAVRDSGTGIPAEDVPHLFERFYRVKGAHGRTFEGSGIGLALVQELVRLHGGTVHVDSEPDRGSTFRVTIPFGKDHLPADRISAPRILASSAMNAAPYLEEALHWLPDRGNNPSNAVPAGVEPDLSSQSAPAAATIRAQARDGDTRFRILIADDNADMRDYLQRLLAPQYEVLAVEDGKLALESARRQRPDLILSDVMMPNLDGFGFLQQVRADESLKNIPLIVLSARAGEESRIEGVQSGADDYLVKPFSARELLARVESHLKLARLRRISQEALARRTAQFETLLNEAPFGVYVVDAQFRIRAVNPAAVSLFEGIPDPIGRDFDEVVHQMRPRAYADEVVQQFRHTLKTGEPYRVPERIGHDPDGNVTAAYEWQINRIPLPEGQFGVVCYFRDILRLVQAREAIRASEERFRAIVETTPDCVKLMAPDGTLLFMNSYGLQMVSAHSPEQVVGKNVYALVAPEDHDKFRTFNQKVVAGTKGSLEFDMLGLDGKRRHMESHAAPLRNSDGSTVQLAVTRDVTPRKQAEQMLRQQRERFELVAQSAQVGFWFCDLPFDKLVWDDLVKEHFWLPPEAEVTIDIFYERLHPDDRERTRQTIAQSIDNDIPYDIEYRTVAPDGRVKWIRATGRTFYDSARRPKSFDGLTFDITQRKQAEDRERRITAEAIAANAKFRAVFEQTTVFAGITTTDGVVIDANKLCTEACGYTPEQVLGLPLWKTPWWRNFKESQEKIRTATPLVAQGIPYREILHYSFADETERLVDFALYPILDDKDQILFLHPTGVDITDFKRAEENYRNLAARLEAEVRSRTIELENRNLEVLRQSDLLREFSQRLLQAQDEERRHIARELHDSAGQTLTVLGINLAQLVQKSASASPDLVADAQLIQETVQQLHNEIRTTSYLLHPPLLDETGLSSALNWYVQGLVERSDLDITLSITENFGRLPRGMELVIFRLVQECLTNIHRHSGSKTASIRIAREPEQITLDIRDEGHGMSPDKVAELQLGGSGVGIRGMRERLRQFDGKMLIESNGSGTQIQVTIPLPTAAKGESSRTEPMEWAV